MPTDKISYEYYRLRHITTKVVNAARMTASNYRISHKLLKIALILVLNFLTQYPQQPCNFSISMSITFIFMGLGISKISYYLSLD